jgi:dihydroxyacetone kinase
MTSLDGPGFSITLLKATSEMLSYIDAPTMAAGWSTPSFSQSTWETKSSRVVYSSEEHGNAKAMVDSGLQRKYTQELLLPTLTPPYS